METKREFIDRMAGPIKKPLVEGVWELKLIRRALEKIAKKRRW